MSSIPSITQKGWGWGASETGRAGEISSVNKTGAKPDNLSLTPGISIVRIKLAEVNKCRSALIARAYLLSLVREGSA